jgi:hypothetical protein
MLIGEHVAVINAIVAATIGRNARAWGNGTWALPAKSILRCDPPSTGTSAASQLARSGQEQHHVRDPSGVAAG